MALNDTVAESSNTMLSTNSTSIAERMINVPAITVSIACIMALTLLGNTLVLVVFCAQRGLRKVIYYPIISLALADMLCALTAMPLYIIKKNKVTDIDGTLVCDLYRFMYFFTEYASISSLMVISLERFVLICKPLTYHSIIPNWGMVIGLVLCWLEAALVSSLPFYWRNTQDQKCTNSPTKSWSFLVITLNVFVPFLIIFICHCYIYHKSLKEFGNPGKTRSLVTRYTNEDSLKRNWKIERRATLSFTVVITVFVVCWGPSTFYYFLRNICPHCFSASFIAWEDTMSATVKTLTFSNSFINPIIYFWLNTEFRKAFLKVFRRGALSEANKSYTYYSQSNVNTRQWPEARNVII